MWGVVIAYTPTYTPPCSSRVLFKVHSFLDSRNCKIG